MLHINYKDDERLLSQQLKAKAAYIISIDRANQTFSYGKIRWEFSINLPVMEVNYPLVNLSKHLIEIGCRVT